MAATLHRALSIAALVVAGGCALPSPPVGEDLRKQAAPNLQVAPQWAEGAPQGEVTDGWLALFHEPALDALVAEAMAYNVDLVIAAARVEAAEASARAAGATLYPQLNLAARGGGKMGGDNSGLQVAGLFASWELDLWGRVRAERATASAQYDAAALDMRYARASIAALVAKSWFLAREAALQRALAAEMAGTAESLAGLSRDRLRIGNGDELEVSQAEASVFSYRDLVLQADLARRNALRAIEILVGRYPSGSVNVAEGLPALPGAVPAGLPSQLLERRPDVRAAERRVAASFYAVAEAKAARLPRIALTAGVNTVSSELFILKERDNPVWGFGGSILLPLFTGGALQAQVDARTAQQKAAFAEYARIGSRAFNEVESALSASFNLENRAEILSGAVQANERALGFARVRYNVGSGDQRGIQQQLLALHAARTTYVHVQAERLIQRVNLHLALGGGFDAGP
jgi:multidrug efflux system outer membrane protein